MDVQEDYSLDTNLAPSLRPDPSKFNQQVDFCFITARHYIWLCKTNELTLTLHGYLKYMKSIHRIHNHQTASQSLPKEWTFLNGILNFNHLLVPRSPMPLIILLYILAFFSFYNECCLCETFALFIVYLFSMYKINDNIIFVTLCPSQGCH